MLLRLLGGTARSGLNAIKFHFIRAVLISSEVANNKEGKMHKTLSGFLGGTKQVHVFRLVVVCRFAGGLWRVKTNYWRNKKEKGHKRQ